MRRAFTFLNSFAAATAMAALVYLPLPAVAQSDLSGGALRVGDLRTGDLRRGALGPPPSSGATPDFDTGDPETVTWGPPSTFITGMTLLAEYYADDVTTSGTETWAPTGRGTADVTLTSQGDGATTTGHVSPALDVATATKPNDRFASASAPGIAFGTQDLAIVALLQSTTAAGGEVWLGNTSASAGSNGIELFTRNIVNGRAYCRFVTSVASTDAYADGTGTDDEAWQLVYCLMDRDGYMAVATQAVSFDVTAAHVAMTESGEDLNNNTYGFTLGGRASTSTLGYSAGIGFVQVYGCDGCLTVDATPTEYDADKDAYAAKVFGADLDVGGAPSTATRASFAWLRRCNRTDNSVGYALVGDNWPRRELSCGYTWANPTSSETTVASFKQERAFTNIADFGNLLDNAAWTKLNSATVTADQQNDPAGNATLDDINGVAASGEHGVSQAQTLTAATYILSGVFKPGNQTFAYADVSSIANVSAYWDSSDCQPDTVGSAATAYGLDLGDLCYVYLAFTGTAASHTHRLLCAEADGDKDYAGASGDCAYGWVSIGSYGYPGMPSPVLTTSAANVARSEDTLEYTTATLPTSGGFTALSEHFNNLPGLTGVNAYTYVAYDSTAGVALSRVGLTADSNNRQRAITRHDGQTLTSTSAVDNETRTFGRITAGPGASTLLYVNGTLADTDAELTTMPTAWDTHAIGRYPGFDQYDGSVTRLRFYAGPIAPGGQGTGDDTP